MRFGGLILFAVGSVGYIVGARAQESILRRVDAYRQELGLWDMGLFDYAEVRTQRDRAWATHIVPRWLSALSLLSLLFAAVGLVLAAVAFFRA